MDWKFIDLKNLDKLEGLSSQNVLERFMEEQERFPLEIDEAELFRLKKEFESSGNCFVESAIEKVERAAAPLRQTLDGQYAKRRKLLAEKAYLTGETAKQRATAEATVKLVDETDLNMSDRRALDMVKTQAQKTISRMDGNMNLLERWDSSAETISRRRNHLRRLMGRKASDADKYEMELGSKMFHAKQSHTYHKNWDLSEKMNKGGVNIFTEREGLLIQYIHVDNIATPLPEVGYLGGNEQLMGYLALMEQIPEIVRYIRQGMSVAEILSNGELKERASQLINQESPIVVSKIGDTFLGEEHFQAIDLENQRRVLAARIFNAGLVAARSDTVLHEN
jgi:hypothetical protein